MNLFNRSILPFLILATFFGLSLVGCLDAPNDPGALKPVESIRILVKQKESPYSAQLKVHPSDSATLYAEVSPEKYQDDLKFEWIYASEKKDSLLTRGASYTFYPNDDVLPNKLTAIDGEGNRQTQEFNIIVNTPPVLSDSTVPASGDTLYGTSTSAFLFSWNSIDIDLLGNDSLIHTLDIDGKEFEVGSLLQVKQSRLTEGEHKFRIIVRDIYGDADTLSYKKFYVIDTLEAK
jgi:hypothetical protein